MSKKLFIDVFQYYTETEAQLTFMEAAGQTTHIFNWDQAKLYAKLIKEEYEEFRRAASRVEKTGAIDPHELTEMIDAAFDLVVVAKGFIHSLGIPIDDLMAHGWESNLNKIDPETGTVRKREDGKVLKPEGWRPPNFAKFNPLLYNYDPDTGEATPVDQ
jgi:predicted HAD superfamily Cof-like phosphohydrolase